MSALRPKSVRELRRFGFAFGTAMTILGGVLLWRGRGAAPWVLGLAAVALVSAALAPKVLRPLEKILATLLMVVMTVVTYVVLTLAFFLVIMPIGVVMRLFGQDLLGRRFPTEKKTYWVPVEEDGPASRPDKPY
jgi:phosphotransferase system  glucose/maltose/N-acetylglucosamine-specific IIC component